jgi:hypothetical protein
MKKYLLCALVLIAPAAVCAQDSVRIDHVGLGTAELFGSNLPTPVRVHIPALPQAQTLQLQFQFETSQADNVPLAEEPNSISKQLQVAAGAAMDVELPLPLPPANRLALKLMVFDPSGREIGEALRVLKPLTLAGQNLAIIYCAEKKPCDDAWSQILASAEAQERVTKKRTRMIESVSQPLLHWWEYAIADAVVVSGPTSQLVKDQRDAFENYMRSGGTLILLEKEIADPSFLAAYRQGPPSSDPILVGRGRLIRLPGLESKTLGGGIKWGAESGNPVEYPNWSGVSQMNQDYFLGRVGISFTFPRLRWLIIWLSVFIVVVGPANFILLKKLGKLEWGWVTTCIISVIFAAGLYITNSARRPRDFTLDDTAIYWMDPQSPMAFARYAFRVYSPEHSSVALTFVPDEIISQPEWNQEFSESGADIGVAMTGKKDVMTGWQEQLGPPQQVHFPMFRWSFQDFHAQGFREFSGAVHWTSAMHLKNDTGQTFQQALYLDFKSNRQFLIPQVAPGQEIDLSTINSSVIYKTEQAKTPEEQMQQFLEQRRQASEPPKPFTVAEIPYAGQPYLNQPLMKSGRAFIGWIDSQTSDAKLDIPFRNRPGGALVIVTLDQQ